MSYFTSDPIIGRDAARVFNYITGYAEPIDIEKMAISPLTLRKRMIEGGFSEYQTPILTASSTEGARDYMGQAILHPGKLYALPQAPAQSKLVLMVEGLYL